MTSVAPDPAGHPATPPPAPSDFLRAGYDITFVPADPPRDGMFVLYRPQATDDGDLVGDTVDVVVPAGTRVRRRTVPAHAVGVAEALPALLALGDDLELLPPRPSALAWSTAVAAGLGVLARGQLVPSVTPSGADAWRAGPLDPADRHLLDELAAAFPAAAFPVSLPGSGALRLHHPAWLVRACWDALADRLPRTAAAPLIAGAAAFAAVPPQPAGVLRAWLDESLLHPGGGAAVALRIEFEPGHAPGPGGDPGGPAVAARAVVQLTSRADPSLVVDAGHLFATPAAVLARFGDRVEEDLLVALHRGARAWPPLTRLLDERAPTGLDLDDDAVEDLVGGAADVLHRSGIDVLWPSELLTDGLTVRATVAGEPGTPGVAGFSLTDVLEFRWQLALDGEPLSDDELAQLVEAKRGVVRLRGRWVVADTALIARATARRARRLSAAEALGVLLAGEVEVDGETVPVTGQGAVVDLADRLRDLGRLDTTVTGPPPGLAGELRPYQLRGVAWLDAMCTLGLGGCLADDMGLGKTIQVIGLHLHRRARGSGPLLVVCPTSLLGNWERELHRFAPGVPVRRYHGGERHLDDLADDEVVVATYGVARRDHAELSAAGFSLVVADEAQHAKNPRSATARALRAITSDARVALTGTPVENRLSELWAILDWSTPGLLGPLERFRRSVAVPVERYRDPEATERLARMVRPFLLRRQKSDPLIAPELPPRTVSDLPVPLTTEQATLYGAEVAEAMDRITQHTGIERRGQVLRLLTVLKQICNHPAQYLHQRAPVAGRSGKLAALEELLGIIVAEGDSVLVFSQFVEMLTLIESRLADLGIGTLLLHGGVQARRRNELVQAFQDGAAPVFLLSLKAGGVGLNLTRATHVVHYDRWWNPAVEDQATDRAHRIGQDRPVQVHRLIAEGTLEDRIATMLERKRALADAVVGQGEHWLTELSDDELAELVALGSPGTDDDAWPDDDAPASGPVPAAPGGRR